VHPFWQEIRHKLITFCKYITRDMFLKLELSRTTNKMSDLTKFFFTYFSKSFWLLGDFVPQIPYRGSAPGPRWEVGTFRPPGFAPHSYVASAATDIRPSVEERQVRSQKEIWGL